MSNTYKVLATSDHEFCLVPQTLGNWLKIQEVNASAPNMPDAEKTAIEQQIGLKKPIQTVSIPEYYGNLVQALFGETVESVNDIDMSVIQEALIDFLYDGKRKKK